MSSDIRGFLANGESSMRPVRVHDEFLEHQQEIDSGRIMPNESTRAFDWSCTDLQKALSHLKGLNNRSRPDQEVKDAFKAHVQKPNADSIFGLAQQICEELDQLLRRTNMGS